jgi:hypothetical protein
LPTWLTGDLIIAGRPIPVLSDWEALIAPGPRQAIWCVHPPKKIVAPKVRAFLSFIEARFGKPPYWDRADHATRATNLIALSEAAKPSRSGKPSNHSDCPMIKNAPSLRLSR